MGLRWWARPCWGENGGLTMAPAPRGMARKGLPDGAQGGTRTPDTGIFSPLLYRLSYLGNASSSMICPNFTAHVKAFVQQLGFLINGWRVAT